MTEHEKALEAAKVIREYCRERPNESCDGCIFNTDDYSWGNGCIFDEPPNLPIDWNLEEAERKCHDEQKSN